MRVQFRITYDNWENGNNFILQKPNVTKIVFQESHNGLYYHEIRTSTLQKQFLPDPPVYLVSTVEENKKWFTSRQLEDEYRSGKGTRKQPIPVLQDFIKIPQAVLNLQNW